MDLRDPQRAGSPQLLFEPRPSRFLDKSAFAQVAAPRAAVLRVATAWSYARQRVIT
jgi:hypothetical protein